MAALDTKERLQVLRADFETHPSSVVAEVGLGMVRGNPANRRPRGVVALFNTYTTVVQVNHDLMLNMATGAMFDENGEIIQVGLSKANGEHLSGERLKGLDFVSIAISQYAHSMVEYMTEMEPLPLTPQASELILPVLTP